MNPFNIRQPQDRRKVYNEYMANLQMQIDNLAKTEAAVSTLKTTGAPPIQPSDTRTVAEKLLDVDKQKKVLGQALLEITDGAEASKIMDTISDEDVLFLGIAWSDFSKMIKQKFAAGILAPIFKEVLQRYKRDYINGLSVQKGISSGHTTEELLLSMRDLMRLMPNADQLRELNYTIQNLPAGTVPPSMKSTALTAVSSLDSLLLTTQDIETLDKMNPIDRAAAEKALNDGFSSIATGAVIQSLTQKLQQSKGKEVPDILSTIIRDILITRDDKAQLEQAKAIAEQKKAAYETSIPELTTITAKKKKALTSQITRTSDLFGELPEELLPAAAVAAPKALTQQLQDDITFLDDLSTTDQDITGFTVPRLRAYLVQKSREGDVPITKAEINKLKKNSLVDFVIGLKAGQFLSAAAATPIGTPRASSPVSTGTVTLGTTVNIPSKSARKAAKKSVSIFSDIEWTPDFTETEFEDLSFGDKRNLLKDMDQKGIMLTELSKDQYDQFAQVMFTDDPQYEEILINIFNFVNKKIGGKGLSGKSKRITFGCGLVTKAMKPTLMVKPDNIDFEKGLKKEASYIPIGKYVINKHKLRDNMLLMRTVKGGQIAELPQMTISPHLGKMLNKIIQGHGFPSHSELTEMNDSDKDIMYKVFKMSKAEGIDSIPRPNKSKDEQEFNRFTILKGQIIAGNNSKELIKEFKTLLVKLIHSDKILRKDGHAILLDLAALGF